MNLSYLLFCSAKELQVLLYKLQTNREAITSSLKFVFPDIKEYCRRKMLWDLFLQPLLSRIYKQTQKWRTTQPGAIFLARLLTVGRLRISPVIVGIKSSVMKG